MPKNLTLVDLATAKILKGGINFNFDPPLRFTGVTSKLVISILDNLDAEDIAKPITDVATGVIISMGIRDAFESIVFSKGLKIDFE
jgi:hypothetical protein